MAGTSPEQLRRTVVRAALPLLADFDTLTTAQIAHAAGVEEVDLLAVFPDKEAVMQACAAAITTQVRAILEPTDEVRKLNAIRPDLPLESRLVEVLGIIDAYHRRVRADLRAFEQGVLTDTADAPATPFSGGKDLQHLNGLPEVRQAVARLLEPDRQTLRLPVEALAEAFLTISQAGARTPNEERSPLPAAQVVDLFLHGALTVG